MFINLFLNIEYTINDNQVKSCAVECTEISIKKQALANTHYRVSHVPVFKRSKAWESSWLQMKVKVSVTSVVSDSSWPQGQPGSSVHGILQASILEWVAVPFLQGIFLTQGSNLGFLHCRQILYHLSHQGSPILSLQIIFTALSMYLRYSSICIMPKLLMHLPPFHRRMREQKAQLILSYPRTKTVPASIYLESSKSQLHYTGHTTIE